MSRKKRGKKSSSKQKKELRKTEEEEIKEEEKSPSEPSPIGQMVVKGLYLLFALFAVFFIYCAYSSLTGGNHSILLMAALALCGFLIAFLSRQLMKSAYFQLYRSLAILLFLAIAIVYFYWSNLDGFTYGLVSIFAACVLITSLIPYYFEGLAVEKVILFGLVSVFVLMVSFILLANSIMIPRENVMTYEGIFPTGVVFGKEGKKAWVYGDNSIIKGKDDSTVFSIFEKKHPNILSPEAPPELPGKKKKEEKKKDKKDKKTQKTPDSSQVSGSPAATPATKSDNKTDQGKDAKEKEIILSYKSVGKSFSSSADREGRMIAVAGLNIDNSAEHTVIVVELKTMKKKEILRDMNIQPMFPGLSSSYPGYTTWNPGDSKFFFLAKSDKGENGLFVADIEKGEPVKVNINNVLSAYWVSDDELRILTGEKEESLIKGLDNHFFPGIKKAELYSWKSGEEAPTKITEIDSEVKRVSIHPVTSTLLTFDGKNVGIMKGTEDSFSYRHLDKIPGEFTSIVSYSGKFLAYSDSKTVNLYNLDTGKNKVIEKTSDSTTNFTFTGDSRYLLYSSHSGRFILSSHFLIKIYDIKTGKILHVVPNFLTGTFRTGGQYAPSILMHGYYYDLHNTGAYFDTVKFTKPGASKEASLWRLITLYPEVERKPEKENEAVKSPTPAKTSTPVLSPTSTPVPAPTSSTESTQIPVETPVGTPTPEITSSP